MKAARTCTHSSPTCSAPLFQGLLLLAVAQRLARLEVTQLVPDASVLQQLRSEVGWWVQRLKDALPDSVREVTFHFEHCQWQPESSDLAVVRGEGESLGQMLGRLETAPAVAMPVEDSMIWPEVLAFALCPVGSVLC